MVDENEVLIPVEEKLIEFYEDEVVAVAVEAEERRRIYVPLRPIVEYLGLAWSGQYERVQRDPALSEVVRYVRVTRTNRGGNPNLLSLPIEFLHGWLFSISVNRVKEGLRPKILRYQLECYQVLYEAFYPASLTLSDTTEAMMRAMRENARQQMELWDIMLEERRRLRVMEEVVGEQEELLLEHELRLSQLQHEQARFRTRLADVTRLLPSPNEPITSEQKATLQELVKELVAAAQDRGIRLGQGRSDYPAVWGAFNQRFRIAKYAELPGRRFDEAVRWLEAWRTKVVEEG